jgi:two-component system NtrC family sensor kinase
MVRGGCREGVEGCQAFKTLEQGKPTATVRKHFDGAGNPHYAAIVSGPVVAADGEVVGAVEMTRDITHRIELEEELKATEVQLQQFMEMAPLATYVKNRQGQYLQVNPATCALFERSSAEILGRTDREMLPQRLADAMVAGDSHVVSSGKEMRFSLAIEREGEPLHLSTVKYPIVDADGNVSAVCGITEDVTATKAAEAELTRTREYLQGILDNSQVAIITTDLEGRVVSFNRGAEESLGYAAADIIGQLASKLYREPDERVTLLRRLQREGAVRDHHSVYLRADGTPVQVSLTLSPLRDPGGEMIGNVAVCKDISHRRVLMNQIIQSERLAAVGRLAAGVAHEINNPLAVIGEVAGYLIDVLDEDPEPAELVAELRNWLPKLSDQVRRGRSVTYRMLSFARKSEADVNVVHVNDALEEIVPFLEKEASLAGVTIHRDYAGELPRVQVEEMQLQEIFINLIKNSLQALHHSGGNIWLSTFQRRGKVVTAIRDDGPGISEEVRDRIFDPFVTTKAPGEGTGLGLSICYGIVKRYDGEIRVESEEGAGATFSVIFPAYRGDTQELETV